ncbi:MAG: Cysteine desulfurase [Parcubacteria group bacterium]|nr:Cysteine desulfurase [Parcubacteria group bacterium]
MGTSSRITFMTNRFFSTNKKRVYLDWASAAPVLPAAQAAFSNALEVFGNPSSPHAEGRAARTLLETARTHIARLASVKPRAVIFTSGATEANALAVQGRINACLEKGMKYEDMHVLYLPTMHASVIETLHQLAKKGIQMEAIPLKDGAIDLGTLEELIRPQTILICVDAVCGETGIRYDTLRIRRIIDTAQSEARAAGTVSNAVLHVDASQLPLVEQIDHTRLGADLMTLDAQKVGGVRGVGVLIIPQQNLISPITHGGGQEAGLRPGTEPVALAAAFAAALTERAKRHEAFSKSATSIRTELVTAITAMLPSAHITEGKRQAPHILNIAIPSMDTDYAVTLLDTDGFAVSTKSACETDSEDGSRAVFAHTLNTELAKSTLRISWGPETPEKDFKRFIPALKEITTFLQNS